MKKILLFTDSLGSGGAQRQLVGLAIMLKNAGYDSTVATYFNLDFYKKQLDDVGIRNVLIPDADNSKKRIMAVRRFFKLEQPDCVIAYQETPSIVACFAKLFGCKFMLIVSERNTTQHISFNERIRFFLYHWADVIVPNSYSQQRFLESHYPWMNKKISTISNFVDLQKFEFSLKEKQEIPLIVIAASIWPPKNAVGFIKAVRILKERGLYFRVEWYGVVETYVDYLTQCRDMISSFGVEDYIKLLPKSKQIHIKYRDCDFFCLPSFYEGTPNVICEAMACGRPVICSAVCDNPVYVADGENGFLFNPAKPETIAAAIERALKITDDEYQQQCRKSREKAELMLSEKVFINKYINVIES